MDDLQLVHAAKKGDSSALGILYDRYVEAMYRFIFYKVSDQELAEDLTSTVFMKVIERLQGYNERKSSFKTWLYTIARNTVIDHYRKKSPTDITEEELVQMPAAEDSTSSAGKVLNKKHVEELMKALSEAERDILRLRFWEELSYQEIGAIIGKSENASKVACSRAVARLRDIYPGMSVLLLHFFTH